MFGSDVEFLKRGASDLLLQAYPSRNMRHQEDVVTHLQARLTLNNRDSHLGRIVIPTKGP